MAPMARADGDPGSDVLVYQDLFVGTAANASVAQQARLGGELQAAARAGFPIRVAVIAGPSDLGAVTGLWGNPRGYAQFLGIELSLAYKQRLLVVMPNGFGINWPGHSTAGAYRLLSRVSIKAGGEGLLDAAGSAVQALSAAAGVKLPAAAQSSAPANAPGAVATVSKPATATGPAPSPAKPSGNNGVVVLVVAAVVLVALFLVYTLGLRRHRRSGPRPPGRMRANRRRWAFPGLALLLAGVLAVSVILLGSSSAPSTAQSTALASNPYLDPGTSLAKPAPDFTLTDQFGRAVSLRSFRGKVVILAFTDSECTTLCPLTTTAMVDAKSMLGRAADQVQLLGIDADPDAISLEDVVSYSELHGLSRQWQFLTGSLPELEKTWNAYGVEAKVLAGQIAHTPALFVIGPHGQEAKVYVTQQSYAAVGQLGQILAQEASTLLPNHPAVDSDISYNQIPAIDPTADVRLPRAGGGTMRFGPDGSPRLSLFFDTWDQEVTGLGGELDALNQYQAAVADQHLPPLTGIDEGSVEPSPAALPRFLGGLPHPLAYPVAIDQTGQVADGYEVQGQPWFVLTSATGRILWYWEVDTSGWLSRDALIKHVRSALARAPAAPTNPAAVARTLAGSPAQLAALHRQASQLLGSEPALAARIKALRGYPIVINAWASWCTPCRSEFGLFAAASAQYGRKVAFIGADTDDSPGDARSFLAQHHVSYPSYQTTSSNLGPLAVIQGLPTTIFLDPDGKVIYVHTGQYDSQGTLDEDIANYALGG